MGEPASTSPRCTHLLLIAAQAAVQRGAERLLLRRAGHGAGGVSRGWGGMPNVLHRQPHAPQINRPLHSCLPRRAMPSLRQGGYPHPLTLTLQPMNTSSCRRSPTSPWKSARTLAGCRQQQGCAHRSGRGYLSMAWAACHAMLQ